MLILCVTSLSEEDVVDVNIVDYEFVRRGCCRC